LVWWKNSTLTLPITYRATATVIRDWRVDITCRRQLMSRLEVFRRKKGLVRFKCGLLKNFKGPLNSRMIFFYKIESRVSHVLSYHLANLIWWEGPFKYIHLNQTNSSNMKGRQQ
jgi:hypothetical protein